MDEVRKVSRDELLREREAKRQKELASAIKSLSDAISTINSDKSIQELVASNKEFIAGMMQKIQEIQARPSVAQNQDMAPIKDMISALSVSVKRLSESLSAIQDAATTKPSLDAEFTVNRDNFGKIISVTVKQTPKP